jgi:two-component system, OmpR family, sensor histidine kinase KdpD
MENDRPNPDVLLAKVQSEEVASRRGTLRIFFGYAAGVGKTYSMLQAARQAAAQGKDVVVGYVEPHARPETQALLDGMQAIPVRELPYRGVTLREFDVDAALQRHPEILLVDELAHTNAEGCRHEKRWQDVQELLAAGINVWSTLNVQHIESLNDVVGQITGIVVRETIPDQVFDCADELELVDVTPEELLHRLGAGKVYLPEQAQRAIERFFQRGNLAALRELSLRQTARRVHSDVESERKQRAAVEPWATNERILVCVGPSPTTARVIRTAKRLATALDAPWMAVAVDMTGDSSCSAAQQQISQHFRLAERLGAETVTLPGQRVAAAILEFARSRNVTKILIGKTNQSRWRRMLFGTVVDDIVDKSGPIDVYVIQGEEDEGDRKPVTGRASPRFPFWQYAQATAWVALAAILDFGLRFMKFADSEANTAMLFLVAVAWAAYRLGRGPAIYSSILSVLVFDFFFVPPQYTFAVADVQYLVTFAVMLAIGLVVSTLTSRLRSQIERTRLREQRTSALYELGKQLSSIYGQNFLVMAAGTKLKEIVSGDVAIYLQVSPGLPQAEFGQTCALVSHPVSQATAQWVIEHNQLAGEGTNTLPNAPALFLPIIGSQRTHGALAIHGESPQRLLDPDIRRFLEACCSQLALALERDQLAVDAADARIQAETEQVRSSLLSGVSHDLKTPLAAIAGASSTLLESESMDQETRRELLETVSAEATRLNRLLENILQMSKLDAGSTPPNREWHVLEEIVGSALHRTRRELAKHAVQVTIDEQLPLIFVDGLLLEQVFVNLLENAVRYTPAGTKVSITARLDDRTVRISVSDNGPGLPPGSENRIFDKFFRAVPDDAGRGSGLGLAICRAIVKVHGGSITASNRPSGGAEFVIRLPLLRDAPRVVVE